MDRVEIVLEELARINNELVTSQRAVYREVAEAEASQERGQRYVSMLAHDLNSPLTVILGYAEVLLADDQLTTAQRTMIERVERSAALMRSLISELTDGFDPQAGDQLDSRPIPFGSLVESVVGRHQLISADKSIRLVLDLAPDIAEEGTVVVGDFTKLERVLNNLIGNAVKYSPAGAEVRVTVDCSDGQVITRVIDQGAGLSEEAQARIFEMFHREPDAMGAPGLGLGLFISRRIAEQHGGAVTVESVLGRGSTFTLILPLDGRRLTGPDQPEASTRSG